MLRVENVTKYYHKNCAVDDVSFQIEAGKIGILLGPNGAGKSTIIKSIAGLLRYKGRIIMENQEGRSIEAKRVFSYVPEMPYMYEALSVYEHMVFIQHAYGISVPEEEVKALLERFELWDKRDKMGNELSKGMMQKVSICCALLTHPKIILLDEPMVGLDPKAIKELKQVVLELKEAGTAILISTHMLEMVKDLWDVLFIMKEGKIVGTYDKDATSSKDIEEIFFEVTGGESE